MGQTRNVRPTHIRSSRGDRSTCQRERAGGRSRLRFVEGRYIYAYILIVLEGEMIASF